MKHDHITILHYTVLYGSILSNREFMKEDSMQIDAIKAFKLNNWTPKNITLAANKQKPQSTPKQGLILVQLHAYILTIPK